MSRLTRQRSSIAVQTTRISNKISADIADRIHNRIGLVVGAIKSTIAEITTMLDTMGTSNKFERPRRGSYIAQVDEHLKESNPIEIVMIGLSSSSIQFKLTPIINTDRQYMPAIDRG